MPSPEQIALQPVLRDIHRYWFGALASPTDKSKDTPKIWFRQSDETDAHIRETFGAAIARAAAIDWDLDALSREEQVGLVILLDQFPRNIYRTSGEAFAYDPTGRAIARKLIAGGLDRFWLQEQNFICLPLVHSEDVADQDYALLLGAQMALDAPEDWKEDRRINLDFATKHRDLIRKFGRFPHRNAMLGRESTPEETEFLKGGRGY
jgi:uncharacterized protein (DUF924 family)